MRRGGVLEGLALEEAGQQEVALLPQPQLVVQVEVGVVGQQTLGLQLDQRGCDEQELRGDLEVEGVHAGQLDQVGVHDPRQRDLVQLDLLAQDQVQEKVERTLEHRSANVVGHRRHGSRQSVRVLTPV